MSIDTNLFLVTLDGRARTSGATGWTWEDKCNLWQRVDEQARVEAYSELRCEATANLVR